MSSVIIQSQEAVLPMTTPSSNSNPISNSSSIPRSVNTSYDLPIQGQGQGQIQAQQIQQTQIQTQAQTQTQIQESSSSTMNPNMVKRVHREVRFGNYILGSTLGEGEFGKVKLGWRKDGKLPNQVAIKLIKRSTIMKDSDSEVKIHREINSLKLLNHPNIVNLVEVMKSGKYIGIVLEYASGGELFDYILHHKYLKENVAKKLFAQLVSGVDYMHSKGLIHRDLKLENLLLDKHKNVIISDFGFVNSYNKDKNDYMKTSCGSPCYAAPELVLTQSPYEGRKVDIWSLGVILYAMLSGYLPFDDDPENEDGSDIVRLYHYICKTPLTFPEYVSPLARDLLRKIIVPEPKKRINMNDIRNHPWLSPYANLLSIRQPEWDKIHKNQSNPSTTNNNNSLPSNSSSTSLLNQNKRFSMINERTNSSALIISNDLSSVSTVGTHGRSYSSTSITQLYSSPSISSSLANAVASPKQEPSNGPGEDSAATASIRSVSPTKSSNRGHTKSASVSNSYPSASIALKAVVKENNSRSSFDSLQQPIFTPPPTTSKHPHFANSVNLQRSNTYTGTAISTIVESPIKQTYNSDESNSTIALNSQQISSVLSPSNPSSRDSNRLPHTTKKPRPTSYHPSSMSSSLMTSNSGSSMLLDYIKIPNGLPVPQFLSSSPTKSIPQSDSGDVDSISPLGKSPKNSNPSRRNSVVTHIHVNGVLSNETIASMQSPDYNKRNSVLSYLEDKIDTLELTESISPVKTNFTTDQLPTTVTPQINQKPSFDTQTSSPTKDQTEKEIDNDIGQTIPAIVSVVVPEKQKDLDNSVQMVQEKSSETVDDVQASVALSAVVPAPVPTQAPIVIESPSSASTPPKEVVKSQGPPVKARESNKENREVKEAKKRNRFSLLSFYSTYHSSSSNVSLLNTPPTSSTNSKKVLEPSNDINIGNTPSPKDQKRIHSNSSTQSRKSNHSTSTSSRETSRDSSAAKKVMDFFKRRSVRIG
ncbi:kinase-like domain-containing protein [Scheffersomyces amazonensis]|uniref:kinase-like domain-containing protein n=1 Tax=Scheffersomyces amazonensis TaxID=1078765 RepID=UPI00315C5765